MTRCNFCDMEKATKSRVPACRRPARYRVRDKTGWWLYSCSYHWKRRQDPVRCYARLMNRGRQGWLCHRVARVVIRCKYGELARCSVHARQEKRSIEMSGCAVSMREIA